MKIIVSTLAALIALSSAVVVSAQPLTPVPLAPISETRPQPDPKVKASFESLLTAIQKDDYEAFRVELDDKFKTALTKELFARVVGSTAPRQKMGYRATFLEQLKQKGYSVYLWKIEFEDGGDDILAQMSMKDSRISGFFLM